MAETNPLASQVRTPKLRHLACTVGGSNVKSADSANRLDLQSTVGKHSTLTALIIEGNLLKELVKNAKNVTGTKKTYKMNA